MNNKEDFSVEQAQGMGRPQVSKFEQVHVVGEGLELGRVGSSS